MMGEDGADIKPAIINTTPQTDFATKLRRLNPVEKARDNKSHETANQIINFLEKRKLATKAHDAIVEMEKAKKTAEEAEALAFLDPLTGLPNRRALDRDLKIAINNYSRDSEKGIPQDMALAFIDLDWFKQINDTYGHEMGDSFLRLMSVVGDENIRNGMLYRLGGDEFVLLLNRISRGDVPKVIERFRSVLTKRTNQLVIETTGKEPTQQVGITAGFAMYDGRETPEQFINRADTGVVYAKQNDRRGETFVMNVGANVPEAIEPEPQEQHPEEALKKAS